MPRQPIQVSATLADFLPHRRHMADLLLRGPSSRSRAAPPGRNCGARQNSTGWRYSSSALKPIPPESSSPHGAPASTDPEHWLPSDGRRGLAGVDAAAEEKGEMPQHLTEMHKRTTKRQLVPQRTRCTHPRPAAVTGGSLAAKEGTLTTNYKAGSFQRINACINTY